MPQIECPSCQTRYEVPALCLPEEGRKVRCTMCKALWIATPQSVVADEPTAALMTIDAGSPPPTAEIPENALQSVDFSSNETVQAVALEAAPTPRPWHQRMAARPEAKARRTPAWQAVAACGAIALAMACVGLRKQIVGLVPGTGKAFAAIGLPVNLRGLEFRDIKSGVMAEDKAEILVVQGEILNVSKTKQPLPRLKFSVRDAKGSEVYAWTAQADGKDLPPGQSLTFRRRLASPPPEGVEVLVRFATRADLVAMAPGGL